MACIPCCHTDLHDITCLASNSKQIQQRIRYATQREASDTRQECSMSMRQAVLWHARVGKENCSNAVAKLLLLSTTLRAVTTQADSNDRAINDFRSKERVQLVGQFSSTGHAMQGHHNTSQVSYCRMKRSTPSTSAAVSYPVREWRTLLVMPLQPDSTSCTRNSINR